MLVTINGRAVEAHQGETILALCKRKNIPVPTLCYHEAFGGQGACRMCMVEVKQSQEGPSKLVASCTYPITQPVEIITESARIEKVRGTLVQLLQRRAPQSFLDDQLKSYNKPALSALQIEPQNCILCRLCVLACEKMGKSAIGIMFRGIDKQIATPYDEGSDDCMGCKACAEICPTQAIQVLETGSTRTIWHQEFQLVCCERCGRAFATEEEYRYIHSHTAQEGACLCPACRKKQLAGTIKKVLEG